MNAANIPVINITDHSAGGDLVSYVGSDEFSLGLTTGRYLLEKMKGHGNVIIIEGVRGSHGSMERVRGFQKALEGFPEVKLLASQPGNFQRLQALQVTENLLQAHPVIDAVMAANDAMALGAIEALDAANRKALVVGINGTKEGIDAIKAGKLLATGDFSGYLQGCVGTMAAIRYAHKLPVQKQIAFPAVVLDSTNYKDADIPDAERECPSWETAVKE
jgi:ribose transport system substrate-binding protein